jgi:[acyl-carrier-protein] S-malonyltransferase
VPYIRNIDAAWTTGDSPEASPEAIRASLVRQVVAPVQWRQSIALMLAQGIDRFWHLGPGRANLSHVKRQARRASLGGFDTPADLEIILKTLDTDAQAERS